MQNDIVKESSISEQKIVGDKVFPAVLMPADKTTLSETEFMGWLVKNKQLLRKRLETHGAILFRDCPINDPGIFEKMLETSH